MIISTAHWMKARIEQAATPLCFAPLAVMMFVPLFSPVLASGTASGAPAFTDPGEIDRAVQSFTGAAVGDTGGARSLADRRLRLAACAQPLATHWHGSTKSAVRVQCPVTRSGEPGWQIFVATRSGAFTNSRSSQANGYYGTDNRNTDPVIRRGEPVTVVVRGRGFSVQQSAEAMENGRVGDWIKVRTTRRGDPLRVRVERPGLAVIPAG